MADVELPYSSFSIDTISLQIQFNPNSTFSIIKTNHPLHPPFPLHSKLFPCSPIPCKLSQNCKHPPPLSQPDYCPEVILGLSKVILNYNKLQKLIQQDGLTFLGKCLTLSDHIQPKITNFDLPSIIDQTIFGG